MKNFDLNLFKTPPKDCSVAPFWFLNGDLTENALRVQIAEMKEQGVDECVLHARKGLTVPYLSGEWFEKIRFILSELSARDMKAWIYDEDNWPSGYAGGKVVGSNPQFAAECLSVEKIYPVLGEYISVEKKVGAEIECVIAVHSDSYFLDITDYENKCAKPWRSETLCWEVFVFRKEKCKHKPAYSPYPYVDLLNSSATDEFIKVTHAAYKENLAEYWGGTIKGFFTDEPGFYQNYLEQCANLNTVIWTENFASRFIGEFGYDIRPYLCCLWQDMGERSVKTRCDYYAAVAKFYAESYFGRIRAFLNADGLKLIGHLHREDYIESLVQTESDFFSAMNAMDFSGIDCIDRNIDRITEKLGSSAAHVYGEKICFSETFGGFGWGLTPEEMKRRTDFQYVQGVNMLVPHAFFYSIDGVRKTESPPSLFYQNGYWKYFKQYADYVKRLSYVCRAGEYRADVLFYFPLKTSWAKFRPLYRYDVHELDRQVLALKNALISNRADFDFYDDVSLGKCKIDGAEFIGGENTRYKAAVMPELSVMPKSSVLKIRDFALAGGVVVCVNGFNPTDERGERDDEYAAAVRDIVNSARFFTVPRYREEEIISPVRFAVTDPVTFGNAEGVYALKRECDDVKLAFLVNLTEKEKTFAFTETGNLSAAILNAETGERECADFAAASGACTVKVNLLPFGSAIIAFYKKETVAPLAKTLRKTADISLNGGWLGEIENKKVPTGEISFHAAGLKNFSGEVKFTRKVVVTEKFTRAVIVAEDVKDYLSVCVNGKTAGARLYSPYEFDVTELLHSGENEIAFTVGNVLENEINGTDNDAGVFGSKRIILYDED